MANLMDFIPREEVDAALEDDPDVVKVKSGFADEVVEYAQSISPEDSGEYKNGIRKRRRGNGFSIEFTDPKSNLIEYGTEDTPEFAVRAKTEAHFQGAERTVGE